MPKPPVREARVLRGQRANRPQWMLISCPRCGAVPQEPCWRTKKPSTNGSWPTYESGYATPMKNPHAERTGRPGRRQGRCRVCGYRLRLNVDGTVVTHPPHNNRTVAGKCPGSRQLPGDDDAEIQD